MPHFSHLLGLLLHEVRGRGCGEKEIGEREVEKSEESEYCVN